MSPRGSSRTEATSQGESRARRLPLIPLALLLVLALVVPTPGVAQQTSPTQTPSQAPSSTTPTQTFTTPGTQPQVLGPDGKPVLGPDGKPFVPATPPPPSQTRIPGAFDTSIIPTGAPRFTFTPSLTLAEQWTDNFFLVEKGRTDNFRTSLTLGLALLMNLANTQGSLSTGLSGVYDTAPDDQNFNFFPTFTANVIHTFTPRLSLTISDTFRRDDDPFLADPNGLRTTRDTFIQNTFAISLNWLVDIFQTQFYYRNVLFMPDNGSNTISNILGGNVSMPLGALNTLTGGYEFTFREGETTNDEVGQRIYASFNRQIGTYTNVGVSSSFSWIMNNNDNGNDSQIWNISLTGSHGVPTGFSVSGRIGYSLFDSERGDPSHLFSFSVNGSYRFARGVISAGVFQDFRQTADEGEDFGIVATRAVFASASYSFTPFITGTVHARYSRNEPVQGGGSTTPPTTYLTAGANISWLITNWLSASLAYLYIDRNQDRSTNIGSNDIDTSRIPAQFLQNSTENRATLTLSASF